MNEINKKEETSVNVHAGHRERLRKAFLRGTSADFFDHQVLEYLLTYAIPRKDQNVTAHLLIKEFGSIKSVLEATAKELMLVKGIGAESARFIEACCDVVRYYSLKDNEREMFKISGAEELDALCVDCAEYEPGNFFMILTDFKMHLLDIAFIPPQASNDELADCLYQAAQYAPFGATIGCSSENKLEDAEKIFDMLVRICEKVLYWDMKANQFVLVENGGIFKPFLSLTRLPERQIGITKIMMARY